MTDSFDFIALPVGQGDAFLFHHKEHTALVDGGKSKAGICDLLRGHGVTSLDVLVCTHNDADHANGVLGLLQSAFPVAEVWLPASWSGVLPRVLRPYTEVLSELGPLVFEEAVARRRGDQPDRLAPPLEELGDRYAIDGLVEGTQQSNGETLPDDGWPPIASLESAEVWHPRWPWWIFSPPIPFRVFPCDPDILSRAASLLREAIEAAHRIRAISLAAYHAGVAVRWFQHDPSSQCAALRWLGCVGARQLLRVRPYSGSLLVLLSLTATNRESLVLWSPASTQFPGVLFTADSDLRDVPLPALGNGCLVTAPHHGSEDNSVAYERVSENLKDAECTWVRSDGRFQSRPGRSYLMQGKRFCTLCRPALYPKQTVRLRVSDGLWTQVEGTRACACGSRAG